MRLTRSFCLGKSLVLFFLLLLHLSALTAISLGLQRFDKFSQIDHAPVISQPPIDVDSLRMQGERLRIPPETV